MTNLLRCDPWEAAHAHAFRPGYALDDYQAFEQYPKFRWVYDRYALHRKYNAVPSYVDNIPLSPLSLQAEWVLKPRINLNGLAKGVQDYTGGPIPPGFIAQAKVRGIYMSADYFCRGDGSVEPPTCYRARGMESQEPYLFYRIKRPFSIPHDLASDLSEAGYQGYLNVETIGGSIIEAHLRPSMQFWDRPKYSIVFRRTKDALPELDPYFDVKLNLPGVKSIQRCWEPGKPLSETDPDKLRYRYLVVNCDDFKEGYYFGQIYSSAIRWQGVNNSSAIKDLEDPWSHLG